VSLAKSQADKLPLGQRQDTVPRTKAVYERAEERFNRIQNLNQQGAFSQEQLEQAQSELEIAKADYDTAIAAATAATDLADSQTELSQLQEKLAIQEQQEAIAQLAKQQQTARLIYQQATEKLGLLRQQAAELNKYQPEVHRLVKATEAGIVTQLPVAIGEQIYGGNAVIELAKLEQLKIVIPVDARLINVLSPQQEALIQLGSGVTAQKFAGKIATINPLPTEKLEHLVEIEFANPNNSLIVGQLAQVQFMSQTITGGQ
jgi:multidrug resistance efflux pump